MKVRHPNVNNYEVSHVSILFHNPGTRRGWHGLYRRSDGSGRQSVPQKEPGSRNQFQREGKEQ